MIATVEEKHLYLEALAEKEKDLGKAIGALAMMTQGSLDIRGVEERDRVDADTDLR